MRRSESEGLLDDLLTGPLPAATPEVKRRHQRVVRVELGHRRARQAQRRAVAWVVVCATGVLSLATAPALSLGLLTVTATCVLSYGAFLLRLVSRAGRWDTLGST